MGGLLYYPPTFCRHCKTHTNRYGFTHIDTRTRGRLACDDEAVFAYDESGQDSSLIDDCRSIVSDRSRSDSSEELSEISVPSSLSCEPELSSVRESALGSRREPFDVRPVIGTNDDNVVSSESEASLERKVDRMSIQEREPYFLAKADRSVINEENVL